MSPQWGYPFSALLFVCVIKKQNKKNKKQNKNNIIEGKYSLYTKVAQHVYCTVTSYTLETKENTVPVFTNSNQVSK